MEQHASASRDKAALAARRVAAGRDTRRLVWGFQLALRCRADDRPAFFAARWFDRCVLRRSVFGLLPFTLARSASMRSMTFEGSFFSGRSSFSPCDLRLMRSFKASS